jgi:hypothetical protein
MLHRKHTMIILSRFNAGGEASVAGLKVKSSQVYLYKRLLWQGIKKHEKNRA